MTYALPPDGFGCIAIVGLTGRFPGARNVEEFWRNLRSGIESITFFNDQELADSGIDARLLKDRCYVKARGVLVEDPGLFDAAFFGFNPREAEITDPQHRIFLECAWEALESAGYDSETYNGSIGVYAGADINSYFLSLHPNPELVELTDSLQLAIGNEKDYVPTRVSYKLNLKGPSVSVNTACSTSLVAVHLACQSLINGECDMALAGGVSIKVPHKRGYLYQEGGIFSPDGHCRAFDAKAQGTVGSSGVGIVVLKRLTDAVSDGDQIHAVIKGSAINNDGSLKVGYTAPSVNGEAEAIAEALAVAGVDPETVTYVEAHGTATSLGDPVEIAALTKAFRARTQKKNFCAIGSVKTNFGHLDTAAGVAGLIKTILALKNKLLPPTLYFKHPNPNIDFENSPFYVNAELTEWSSPPTPRRAGVSSFGIGGTNAHVILEEVPVQELSGPARPWQLLVLSAKTSTALEAATRNLATHFKDHPDLNWADVAYTLQTGRRRFGHRRALVCHDLNDAVAVLESPNSKRVMTRREERQDASVAFMFPGQGAQYANMALSLYQEEALFRANVDEGAEMLAPHLGIDLRPILYPEPSQRTQAEHKITRTFITQPALFIIEYAIAQLWMHWGIWPKAVIGHSLGEYTAACIAGVLSREDASTLVAGRARLMEDLPEGAMLAVRLRASELEPLLRTQLSVAAVNAPSLTVVSGPCVEIEALETQLTGRRIGFRRLPTSHAFHSEMMDPIIKLFGDLVRKVRLNPPQIPWISCLSGDWVTAALATDPNYWTQQLREPVLFAEGIQKLLKDPDLIFLEVGPGKSLSNFVKQNPAKGAGRLVLTSLEGDQDSSLDMQSMLGSLGQLWLAGARMAWGPVHGKERRRRLPLPTYPFERKRFWIGAPTPGNQKVGGTAAADKLEDREAEIVAGEAAMEPNISTLAVFGRQTELQSKLQTLFSELSGIERGALEVSANFTELGFDSLFLTQASNAIQQRFNVKVSFRQLLEGQSTIEELAAYLDQIMPREEKTKRANLVAAREGSADEMQAKGPVATLRNLNDPTNGQTRAAMESSSNLLERILNKQIELMSQQLDLLLTGSRAVDGVSLPVREPSRQSRHSVESLTALGNPSSEANQVGGSDQAALLEPAKTEATVFGPYGVIKKGTPGVMTPHQQKHLDALVTRYTTRTQESKRYTRDHRAHLADPRSVAGFRSVWKELTYPVVVERSSGCKLWDIDGNEYVDLVSGFGSSLFGYSPAFVAQAVEAQLKRGIEIGPQSPLAGEVAQLICELTDMERAAFCNTGSEAVIAALRVARTITGRNKIALFSGSYHGMFDEVLVRPIGASGVSQPRPIAPGIVPDMMKNVLVLEYDSPASLEILRKNSHELAAVLVEPVQSRRPDVQPQQFLRDLRSLTTDVGAALILDEMITGFRSHPGGVQWLFGVKADLATYGKVVGGGLPIGILAGRAKFMDALDGGMWNYGDESAPEAGVTFFAGTFVRHPLALAAAKAILTHLKQRGPSLQTQLNDRTAKFVYALNAYAKQVGAPIRVDYFSSLFCIQLPQDLPLANLFFTYMREKGVHVLEGRPCFLTTAHTDADLDHVNGAFKESIQEMQEAGFLPGRRSAALVMTAGSTQDADKTRLSFALTEAQRELWLAAQMGDDASGAFIESVAMRLRGPLNVGVMLEAVQELVLRHDSLRTTFSKNGEEQHVAEDLKLEVPLTNLADLEHKDREERLAEIAAEESRKSFDLSHGPLLRVHLIRLEERHHVLLLIAHHIVVDGWSIGVLLSELAIIYSAGCRGEVHGLPKPRQFADYARWLTDQRQSSARAASETYWLEQFKEPLPVLELPTDRPRPRMKTYKGARQQILLPRVLFQDLRRVAARQGSTFFAMLLAGFNILLYRLTAQEDIVVGVPAAGQSSFDAQDLVGHCVNFLPLRTRIKGSASFLEYLSSVKKLVLDAYDHQNYTYGSLLQKLKLTREASRLPLVSASFNLDRAPDKINFHGMDVEISTQAKHAVNFDSEINVIEAGGDMEVEWHYNTDLFDAETIRRLLRHYQTLLESLVASPEQRLSDLAILTQDERETMLVKWNATQAPYPQCCVHELFEAQAVRTPNALAVVFENQQLTYRELNQRANQLAHYLRKSGIGPEILVGICTERSAERIIALLAILKAGAAYLPLDPLYPKERLKFMLEDGKPKVLLTQQRVIENLPENDARLICLDTDWDTIACESEQNPISLATPENLAYVIYTSGSTGKPKGVSISHRGIVRLVKQTDYAELGDKEVFLQFAPLGFDASTFEIWGCLVNGGKLVVYPPDVPSLQDLGETIVRSGVSTLWFTSALFRLMVEHHLDRLAGVKQLLAGGDVLSASHAKKFLNQFPGCRLINGYGPTENTTFTCCYPMTSAEQIGDSVSIGRPIANTQVYLLDHSLNPVPIGVSGELYTGGDGLARGYFNNPELTAEKFIAHPFSSEPGARLYRTGDLARYLPDGKIEFLGRSDYQVKLRGYRIELGEIEATLSQHPAVRETVVLAREDVEDPKSKIENPNSDKRLVAYVVTRGTAPTINELKSFVKEKLPEYMVPSAFVFLDRFSLTSNGKIDRKALPAPEERRPELEEGYVAPRTPVEETIAEIWADVLNLDKPGALGNFFDLGGHSLLAIQVISRIRDAFQLEVPVRVLFEKPTIEELALTVEEALIDEIESQTQEAHQIY